MFNLFICVWAGRVFEFFLCRWRWLPVVVSGFHQRCTNSCYTHYSPLLSRAGWGEVVPGRLMGWCMVIRIPCSAHLLPSYLIRCGLVNCSDAVMIMMMNNCIIIIIMIISFVHVGPVWTITYTQYTVRPLWISAKPSRPTSVKCADQVFTFILSAPQQCAPSLHLSRLMKFEWIVKPNC